MNESKVPAEFGIFYPRGWMVAAFPEAQSARQVQRDLLTGGYDESDCRLVPAEQVVARAQDELDAASGLARLGESDDALQVHLRAAKAGSAFLLVHAPTSEEAERVMNVIRRVPFDFVHRYLRWAIQVME